jgi:hypothetical protein
VPFFAWSHFDTVVEDSSDNPNGVAEGEAPFIAEWDRACRKVQTMSFAFPFMDSLLPLSFDAYPPVVSKTRFN